MKTTLFLLSVCIFITEFASAQCNTCPQPRTVHKTIRVVHVPVQRNPNPLIIEPVPAPQQAVVYDSIYNNESVVIEGGIGVPAGESEIAQRPLFWEGRIKFISTGGTYIGLGATGVYRDSMRTRHEDVLTNAIALNLHVGAGLTRHFSPFLSGTGLDAFGGVTVLNPSLGNVGFDYGAAFTLAFNFLPINQGHGKEARIGIYGRANVMVLATPDRHAEWGYTNRVLLPITFGLRLSFE